MDIVLPSSQVLPDDASLLFTQSTFQGTIVGASVMGTHTLLLNHHSIDGLTVPQKLCFVLF